MFTQPCFIRKNSKELAKKLQDIGYYTYHVEEYEDAPSDWCTVTEIEANYAGIWNNEPKGAYAKRCIDCGTNECLFLAIAALRDDSDMYQWFVYPKVKYIKLPGYFPQMVGMDGTKRIIKGYEWHLSFRNDLTERINDSIRCGEDKDFLPHKATAKELIEHFK